MPRKYKRKLGSRIRRDYDPNAMKNALAAVVNAHLSFRQAGEKFSVPYATLYKKIEEYMETNLADHQFLV